MAKQLELTGAICAVLGMCMTPFGFRDENRLLAGVGLILLLGGMLVFAAGRFARDR